MEITREKNNCNQVDLKGKCYVQLIRIAEKGKINTVKRRKLPIK